MTDFAGLREREIITRGWQLRDAAEWRRKRVLASSWPRTLMDDRAWPPCLRVAGVSRPAGWARLWPLVDDRC